MLACGSDSQAHKLAIHGGRCMRVLNTEWLSLVANMNRPPDKLSALPLVPTSGAQQRQALHLPRMLLLQTTRQICGTPLNKQKSPQTLDRLLRFLSTARPVDGTCLNCSLRRERPTYLRPQICVAVQFVGLDVYVLLRSLPCSSNLRCKVFGGQLHHCQAICSTARVSDLDDGLHLSALRVLQLHCMGIGIKLQLEFHANSPTGVVKMALMQGFDVSDSQLNRPNPLRCLKSPVRTN